VTLQYDVFETSFGWIAVLGSGAGLRRTTLPQPTPDECVELLDEHENAVLAPERFRDLRTRLRSYFDGQPVQLSDERIDVASSSPFHQAAWRACRSIPAGQTRSYRWLAEQAGSPRAVRAAGQSMARNRLPIIVPCHRVVASNGSLRGFGRGASQLDLKRSLLRLEAGG
jgi:methylated-DNA-[protein]-cysteine S-methyltransferase